MNNPQPQSAKRAGLYGGGMGLGLTALGGGCIALTKSVVNRLTPLSVFGIALINIGCLLLSVCAHLIRHLDLTDKTTVQAD